MFNVRVIKAFMDNCQYIVCGIIHVLYQPAISRIMNISYAKCQCNNRYTVGTQNMSGPSPSQSQHTRLLSIFA